MVRNVAEPFFRRIRKRFFRRQLNDEIFGRIFPHLRRERDFSYPFRSDEEMNVQTEANNVQALLISIEREILNMPKSYGESFRFIMHRDLCERLSWYEREAQVRIRRPCDPRLVAVHA